MITADYWIKKLNLKKHPEGGWFREVYRSDEFVSPEQLSNNFSGSRNISTSIYYLLENDNISAFHRIKSDEIWHYYTGNSALKIMSIENGSVVSNMLGSAPDNYENFQILVPKNTWFAVSLKDTNGFALVGCTVSPGFDFDDFELADKKLIKEFPNLKNEISRFIKK